MANIKKWRESVGLTQLQVAKALEISNMTVSRYETGAREPRATELIRMAQLFGCTVDELLIENPTPPLSQAEQGETATA